MIKKGLILFSIFISAYVFAQVDTIRLMFTGDIMIHGPQLEAAYNEGSETYDFDESFLFVKKIFRNADFVIGNLETTLGTEPYSGYPYFSAPPELATALKKAGFTHLVTANNHACDKGKEGIVRTIENLNKRQIGHTGTYASAACKEENPFLILQKKGIKIILLNYTYGTNGLPVPSGTYVNLIDKAQIKQDIATAKSQHPDEIIVFLHWGEQYRAFPSEKQKEIEKFLHEQGIRIIIGSHPHVIQPIKFEKGKLTVYSLGNFISNQRNFPRDGAFIFQMDMTKENGKTKIIRAGYIPVWVYKYAEYGKNNFEILPVDEFITESSYFTQKADFNKFLKFNRYITRFMNKNAGRIERISDYVPRYRTPKLIPVFSFHPGIPRIFPYYRMKTF